MHIGLLCAMPEEIGSTIGNLQNTSETKWGDLKIISGEWYEHGANLPSVYISTAWSGWGKVSAARAATRLLGQSFKGRGVDLLLFTGVAGAANPALNQWDIVLPTELIQHDMDARPLFQKYVIPALNKGRIASIDQWVEWAITSLQESVSKNFVEHFGKVETGLIATGDRFIADKSLMENLSRDLPGLSAVEMEGAAVAQVACQEKVPWLIIRVISDGADDSAAQTFSAFLKDYEKFSWNLIEVLLNNHKKAPLINSSNKVRMDSGK
tara:strand:+ start:1333 stop:2133 length:801 start_codon:yes stop_codon:yes gene_type:complete